MTSRNYLVHQEHLLDRLERHVKEHEYLLLSIQRIELAVLIPMDGPNIDLPLNMSTQTEQQPSRSL